MSGRTSKDSTELEGPIDLCPGKAEVKKPVCREIKGKRLGRAIDATQQADQGWASQISVPGCQE